MNEWGQWEWENGRCCPKCEKWSKWESDGKREKQKDRDRAGFSLLYFFFLCSFEFELNSNGRGVSEGESEGVGVGGKKVAQPKRKERQIFTLFWSWDRQRVRVCKHDSLFSVIATIHLGHNQDPTHTQDRTYLHISRGQIHTYIHTSTYTTTMAARDSAKSTLYVGMEG